MSSPNQKLPTYSVINNGTYNYLYFDDIAN